MNNTKRLEQLALITSTEFRLAQLDLAGLRRREQELRTSLASLSDALRDRANVINQEADAARIAGADVNWQIWVEQRRQLINQELARCLVHQDKSKAAVLKAFGREQAVKDLQKRSAEDLKRSKLRKTNYVS